ncbi:MAG: AAA family ATPase, partial [Methanoregula sp.]|nr:AAA family ATPase [Methanoregula sp.]
MAVGSGKGTAKPKKEPAILVAGDQITDVFLYPVKVDADKKDYNFGISHHYHSAHFRGGIHLIVYFLKNLDTASGREILLLPGDKNLITREMLSTFPSQTIECKKEICKCPDNREHFRGTNFLGIAQYEDNYIFQFPKNPVYDGDRWTSISKKEIGLYVLNDIAKDFRGDKIRWRTLLKSFRANPFSWVILKLSPPFNTMEDDFCKPYSEFLAEAEERLVIIINLQDLRLVPCASIGYQLSWEKTVEDLLYQIHFNPELQSLRKCKKLVIRIGLEAALTITNPGNLEKDGAELYFEPFLYEDSFLDNSEGNVQGISTAFLTGLIHTWLSEENQATKGKPLRMFKNTALQAGLNLAWNMWFWAYGKNEIPARVTDDIFMHHLTYCREYKEYIENQKANPQMEKKPEFEIPSVKIKTSDLREHKSTPWTILSVNRDTRSYGEIAYKIVKEDLTSTEINFPVFRVGNFISLDRREIEGFRSVKKLFREYLDSPQQKTPLSIAVFGPPGAGKSYGIKQLLAERNDRQNVQFLTFNLSQFTDVGQLNSAFHKIRDCSLTGNLPLVFFDEFDSRLNGHDMGWVKYFLAPMQDGGFFDGETSHPIGRAIFVFAGGNSSKYQDFFKKCELDNDGKKEAKLRDFISRLRGHIDITKCDPDKNEERPDELYKIKRGIVLRTNLLERAPQIIDKNKIHIDKNVLRAFIKVDSYIHGVRSIQAIIEMSNLKNKKSFEPSALPPENQLNLHVNAKLFKNLLLRDVQFEEVKDRLCGLLKADYLETLGAMGIRNDDDNKISTMVENIPPYLKELKFGCYRIDEEKNVT